MKKCGWILTLAIAWIIFVNAAFLILNIVSHILFKSTYLATFTMQKIVISVSVVCFIVYCIKRIYKDDQKVVFVFKKISLKNAYSALLVGLTLFFVTNFFGNIVDTLLQNVDTISIISLPDISSFGVFLLMIPVTCVLSVISDELIFRTAIMHYAKGAVFPVIFSALCFSLARFDLHLILQGFIAGLVYAMIYLRTKNVIIVMITHAFTSFLTLLKIYLGTPFKNILLGNSIVEIILFIAATAFLVYLFFSKESSEKTERNPEIDGGFKDCLKASEFGLIMGAMMPFIFIFI